MNVYSYLLGSTLGGFDDSTVAFDNCRIGSVVVVMSGDMEDGGIEGRVVVRMRAVPRTFLLLHLRIGIDIVGVDGLQSFFPDDRPCIFYWSINVRSRSIVLRRIGGN